MNATPLVRRSFARLAILAILLPSAACQPPNRVADLWAYPEIELRPADATVLDKRERPARTTIEGRDTASVGYLLGAKGDQTSVEQFYEGELAARGWAEPTDLPGIGLRARTSAELFARSWRKGDIVFRLGILDPADPAAEGPTVGFQTVYRIDIVDRPIHADSS